MSLDYEVGSDALHRDIPEPHEARIPVFGIPVTLRSNAAAVVEVFQEAFGVHARASGDPARGGRAGDPAARPGSGGTAADPAEDGVVVRILVVPGAWSGPGHAPLHHHVPGRRRVMIGAPGSVAVADIARGEAVAYVTEGIVRDRQHFRYGFVEALTMNLVTKLDREPLHGAAVVRDGTGLILAAPSGAGKSSLAFAAMQDGLEILAEDTVHLQLRPRLRAWGAPSFIHLPEDARRFFPDLAEEAPTLLANGKTKIAVDVRAAGSAAKEPFVENAGICIVERRGPDGLETLSPREIGDRLTADPEPGFDLFADTIGARIRALAARGGWRLRLPPHPGDAVPCIHAMLDRLDAAGVASGTVG